MTIEEIFKLVLAFSIAITVFHISEKNDKNSDLNKLLKDKDKK